MAEENKLLGSDLPPLREIEQAGARAADRRARSLLKEMFEKGGSINLEELERAGPQVRTAFLQLLAEEATRPPTNEPRGKANAKQLGPSGPSPRPTAAGPPPAPTAPSASPGKAGAAPQRRASMEWLDQRCEAPNFEAMAIYHGLAAALAAFLGAVLLTLFFQL